MRFYPKPAGRPEFPAPILQGKQLAPRHAAIVTVFAARAAAPPPALRGLPARPAPGCRRARPRCARPRNPPPADDAAAPPPFGHATPDLIRTVTVTRQLTLDLGTPPPSTFDNFYSGTNAELVTRLRELDLALAAGPVADRTFYVWGEAGSGRSHLLQALVHDTTYGHARYVSPQGGLDALAFDPRVSLYAVDDCDALNDAQQIALFNLFNEVRAHPMTALVVAGPAAPLALDVREDLRTRLGWGLVFHLAPLTDEGKAAVLKHAAKERGIALADDVPSYLLTHFRRDMPSLMSLLDALDRFSLEQKRAVTLPLLRAMLAAPEREEPAPGRFK